jgi:hypothetical protein
VLALAMAVRVGAILEMTRLLLPKKGRPVLFTKRPFLFHRLYRSVNRTMA